MNKLLRKTISYHDYREDFYHAFLAGIFAGAGYMVESNREHGEGRSDVVVYDAANGNVPYLRRSIQKNWKRWMQIVMWHYARLTAECIHQNLKIEYDHIFCYGISFFKKRCIVKKK